jgi:hypothetical protein
MADHGPLPSVTPSFADGPSHGRASERIEGLLRSTFLPSGTNFVQNADFSDGTTGWLQFATPDMSYIVSDVTGGVFRFYRRQPPAGTTNQALVFRETGIPIPANAALQATFDLGNSDTVRKRISVLVHDSNFTDLFVCTFCCRRARRFSLRDLDAHDAVVVERDDLDLRRVLQHARQHDRVLPAR